MKTLKKIILCLLAVLSLTACDDVIGNDVIYDYYPVVIDVAVSDSKGNDLLADSAFVDAVTIDYNGTRYSLERERKILSSRAYLALLHYPYVVQYPFSDNPSLNYICLGEWAGDSHWDETLTINWPDGSKSTVAFTLKKYGRTNAKYYLDGVKQGSSVFHITLPTDRLHHF